MLRIWLQLEGKGTVALRFVDNFGKVTKPTWLTRTAPSTVLRR